MCSGGDINEMLNKSKAYNRRNKKSNFFQGLFFYLWLGYSPDLTWTLKLRHSKFIWKFGVKQGMKVCPEGIQKWPGSVTTDRLLTMTVKLPQFTVYNVIKYTAVFDSVQKGLEHC